MKFFIFAISFIIVVGLSATYVARRLTGRSRTGRTQRITVALTLFFIVAATPVTILFRHAGIENTWIDLLAWLGYVGLGFMSFVLTFLIIRDILMGISLLMKKSRSALRRDKQNAAPENPQRRHFLTRAANMGILAGAGVFTGVGYAEAKQTPEVKHVRIPLKGLPPEFAGFRIVQLTDIHVSPTTKRPFVEKVVTVANTLSADIVALTGDLVDGSVSYLAEDVAPLAHLKSVHGKFFVTGNHEYYSGVGPWITKMQALGFTVLLNEHTVIQKAKARMIVAGVTDYSGGRFDPGHRSDPAKAISGTDPSNIKLLLAISHAAFSMPPKPDTISRYPATHMAGNFSRGTTSYILPSHM